MSTLFADPGVEAVIFDVDGTLIDTVDYHAEAWQRAFAQYGKEVDFGAIRSQIGKGGDQLLPVFLTKDEIARFGEQLEKDRGELFRKEYLPKVKPFPCTRELFEALLSRGKKVALASSAKKDELEAYERIAKIDDLVEHELSSDDAERSKPHPDIFEAALERLRTDPGKTVVVGDTPYDAEAAAKADMRTIGVLSGGFPKDSLALCSEVWPDVAAILAELES